MAILIAYECGHRWEARTSTDRYAGLVSCMSLCRDCRPRPTLRIVTADGEIIDTKKTEGEHNGWTYTRDD